MRRNLGLDQPLPYQYLYFLGNVVTGDFGRSFASSEPALRLILDRLPATLELASVALLLSVVVGVPLGMFAGFHSGSRWDSATPFFSLFVFSVPRFWIGIIRVLIFSVAFGFLSSFARGEI